MLYFTQLNMNHSSLVSDRLRERLLLSDDSHVFFIQEPYLYTRKTDVLHFPRNWPHKDRIIARNHGARAMLYSTRDVNLVALPKFITCDVAAGLLHTSRNEKIVLISGYFDGTKNSFPDKFFEALRWAKSKNLPFIASCDANAHNVSWGSPEDNERGIMFEEAITEFPRAEILNVGNQPTYIPANTHTDVQLIDNRIAHKVSNWRVDITYHSDHAAIRFEYDPCDTNIQPSRNLRRVDWDEYEKNFPDFEYAPPAMWTPQLVESEIAHFNAEIMSQINEVAPLITKLPKKYSVWWNPEIGDLEDKANAILAAEGMSEAYKAAKKHLKYIQDKAKIESFRRWSTEVYDIHDMTTFMKVVKSEATPRVGLMAPNQEQTDSVEDTIKHLFDTHFPGNTNNEPHVVPNSECPHKPVEWLNPGLVRLALEKFGSWKTSGGDSLTPIMLKHLPPHMIDWLSGIFHGCFLLAYTPEIWTVSDVVFIAKPDRPDYGEPKAFRPISLTSFLHKTMERMVLMNIENVNIDSPLFHDSQHAFRKGRSTDSALSQALNFIEKAFLSKKYALGAFLDIEGAFDGLAYDSIAKGLIDKGVAEDVRTWLHNYLTNRKARVRLHGHSTTRKLTQGTPQGGVLSPCLWNFCLDSLLQQLEEMPVTVIAFADDILILSAGLDPACVAAVVTRALQKAYDWGLQNHLKFSPTKSKVVWFTRKLFPHGKPPVFLGPTALKAVDEIRYLGLIFDSNLTWRSHILDKLKKVKRLVHKVRNFIGKTWGMKSQYLIWAYETFILPILTYGCHCWAQESEKFTLEFTRLQRCLLLGTGNYRHSTPTRGLEMIFGVPPLELKIRQVARATFVRIGEDFKNFRFKPRGKGKRGHLQWCQESMSNVDIPLHLQDTEKSHRAPKNLYQVDITSFNTGSDEDHDLHDVTVYTDGSRMGAKPELLGQPEDGGTAGCGVFIEAGKGSSDSICATYHEGLGRVTTVFQSEVYAITCATNFLLERIPQVRRLSSKPKPDVHMYCDSQSTLLALHNTYCRSKTVHECRQKLNQLAEHVQITLSWVKAHATSRGNMICDDMAKLGANSNVQLCEPALPMPQSYVKSILKQQLLDEWTILYHSTNDFRQTKLFWPFPDMKKSKEFRRLDREVGSRTLRALCGHSFHKAHWSLQQPPRTNDDRCRLCDEGREDPWHLTRCPSLRRYRMKIWPMTAGQFPDNWKLHEFIKYFNHPNLKNLEEDQEFLLPDPRAPT